MKRRLGAVGCEQVAEGQLQEIGMPLSRACNVWMLTGWGEGRLEFGEAASWRVKDMSEEARCSG